jgi:hypothetical protein
MISLSSQRVDFAHILRYRKIGILDHDDFTLSLNKPRGKMVVTG